jgi:glutamine synthetase
VLVCIVDMQGRLMGKRFHAQNFVESATRKPIAATICWRPTSKWRRRRLRDDELAGGLRRLRHEAGPFHAAAVPWLEGTAMVLCDMLDHHTHEPVPHSPRQILKKQIARLAELGFEAMMATELEFFLFEKASTRCRKGGLPRPDADQRPTTRITTSSRPPRKRT